MVLKCIVATSCICSDCTSSYLYIHGADLTLTEKVCTAAGQGGVNSPSTRLDDLREGFGNILFTTSSQSFLLSTIYVFFKHMLNINILMTGISHLLSLYKHGYQKPFIPIVLFCVTEGLSHPLPCGQELFVRHLFWVVSNSKDTAQQEAILWN